jgi:hypothetical protein
MLMIMEPSLSCLLTNASFTCDDQMMGVTAWWRWGKGWRWG